MIQRGFAAAVAAAAFLLWGCDRLERQMPILQSAARSDHFERKRVCMEIGYKAYERDERDLVGSKLHMFNPEFCYNDSLNTCLYAGGLVGPKYKDLWVRDCLTNNTILSFTVTDG